MARGAEHRRAGCYLAQPRHLSTSTPCTPPTSICSASVDVLGQVRIGTWHSYNDYLITLAIRDTFDFHQNTQLNFDRYNTYAGMQL